MHQIGDPKVEAFFRDLDDPAKPTLLALRALLLEADPSVAEGFKWNTASFRTSDYFATASVHPRDGVRLILHTGAKRRAVPAPMRSELPDPEGMIRWLAEDRGMVVVPDLAALEDRRAALTALTRAWIARL